VGFLHGGETKGVFFRPIVKSVLGKITGFRKMKKIRGNVEPRSIFKPVHDGHIMDQHPLGGKNWQLHRKRGLGGHIQYVTKRTLGRGKMNNVRKGAVERSLPEGGG